MNGTQVALCSHTVLGAPPEATFPPESQGVGCLTSGIPKRRCLLRSHSAHSPKQLPVRSGTGRDVERWRMYKRERSEECSLPEPCPLLALRPSMSIPSGLPSLSSVTLAEPGFLWASWQTPDSLVILVPFSKSE